MTTKDYQSEILNYLKEKKSHSNMAGIVRALGITKITASKYLKKMEQMNLVSYMQLTKTRKLWYYKT
jgi:DNA-binding MarR family transcriptional regulator